MIDSPSASALPLPENDFGELCAQDRNPFLERRTRRRLPMSRQKTMSYPAVPIIAERIRKSTPCCTPTSHGCIAVKAAICQRLRSPPTTLLRAQDQQGMSFEVYLVSKAYAKYCRQTTERTNGSVATSEQTMESMTQALYDHFSDWRKQRNPEASDRWSPQLKGQYKLYLEMIKTTPRQQWLKAIETIADQDHREIVRQWNRAMDRQFPTNGKIERQHSEDGSPRNHLSRQAKTFWPSLEHRRSSRLTDAPNNGSYNEDDDYGAGDTDGSHSPDKTYRKDHVDAHPNELFHHAGNGWWKRGPRPNDSEKTSDRRDSSASHAIKYSSSEASRESDGGATIHKEELYKYPGMTFHHKGNRWYKPGIGPSGVTGCITVSADGQIIGPKRRRSDFTVDSNEMSIDAPPPLSTPDLGHTVNKAYADLHPEVEWVHRGGGRYKRKASLIDTGTVAPAGSSDRRSSRAENSFSNHYAASRASDELRRSSNRRRNSKLESLDDEPGELFDKAYVDAHPDEKFYHRGQGRYARGDRPKAMGGPSLDHSHSEEKFDKAYVDAHPNETFHHRGQGRWARGLPPPHSNSKTAVRGPGALEMYKREKSPQDGPKPPPLTALLKKQEGPDLWRNLNWQYRGGGKWCQVSKEEAHRLTTKSRKPRVSSGRSRGDEADMQLRGEAFAVDGSSTAAAKRSAGLLAKPPKIIRKRSQQSMAQLPSNSHSTAPTPRPALLPPEDDRVDQEDLPSLYKDAWSDAESEDLDDAAKILRSEFDPMIGPEPFVRALTKHDPAVRSLDTLKQLAANAQQALMQLQDEYLALDEIVARHPMNGKKERKAVKGGRQPLEYTVWEDKKEAILYDYTFDPRKTGYQNPDAQRIIRDEEGRELRRRRNRYGHDPHETAVNYGDGEMTAKRAVKPVSRFDGVVIPPPRKRSRLMTTADDNITKTMDDSPSATPNRAASPIPGFTEAEMAAINDPKRGRWRGHVPKVMHQAMHHRLRELRAESVGSQRSESGTSTGSPNQTGARKGRPPGSKNLKPRKDIGIKKGPRKKLATSQATPTSSVEPEMMQDGSVPAIVENPPDDVPAAAAADEPMAIDAAASQAMSLNV